MKMNYFLISGLLAIAFVLVLFAPRNLRAQVRQFNDTIQKRVEEKRLNAEYALLMDSQEGLNQRWQSFWIRKYQFERRWTDRKIQMPHYPKGTIYLPFRPNEHGNWTMEMEPANTEHIIDGEIITDAPSPDRPCDLPQPMSSEPKRTEIKFAAPHTAPPSAIHDVRRLQDQVHNLETHVKSLQDDPQPQADVKVPFVVPHNPSKPEPQPEPTPATTPANESYPQWNDAPTQVLPDRSIEVHERSLLIKKTGFYLPGKDDDDPDEWLQQHLEEIQMMQSYRRAG